MSTVGERLKERYDTAQQKTRELIEKTVSSLGRQKNESSITADWKKIVEYVDGIASLKQEFGFRVTVTEGLAAVGVIQNDPWPKEGDERFGQFGRNVVVPLARLNMGRELEATVREFLAERKVLPETAITLPEVGHIGSAAGSGQGLGDWGIPGSPRHVIDPGEESDSKGGEIPSDEVDPY